MSAWEDIRAIIVAEHASTQFGGEAVLPLHYFRLLRKRGIEAWLVVHERTRSELEEMLPSEQNRIHYVSDRPLHRLGSKLWRGIPSELVNVSVTLLMHAVTQIDQRRLVKELVSQVRATVVHEPIPVSPRAPSLIYDVGAPVVIGPMNGGMTYPRGFSHLQSGAERRLLRAGRRAAWMVHALMPGKRRAAVLLVANERTRQALPKGLCPRVIELVENGVDLSLFQRKRCRPARSRARFAFVGRLVAWKAVDVLLDAMARADGRADVELVVLGDGPERTRLEAQADRLGLGGRVAFHGLQSQRECALKLAECDALVLPSLYECGGAVVLEAMAVGLPVIATRWGGPADYLDSETGILVDPTTPEEFTREFAEAIVRLALSAADRNRMGAAGRRRVEECFDWERKIDRVIDIYRAVQGTALEIAGQ